MLCLFERCHFQSLRLFLAILCYLIGFSSSFAFRMEGKNCIRNKDFKIDRNCECRKNNSCYSPSYNLPAVYKKNSLRHHIHMLQKLMTAQELLSNGRFKEFGTFTERMQNNLPGIKHEQRYLKNKLNRMRRKKKQRQIGFKYEMEKFNRKLDEYIGKMPNLRFKGLTGPMKNLPDISKFNEANTSQMSAHKKAFDNLKKFVSDFDPELLKKLRNKRRTSLDRSFSITSEKTLKSNRNEGELGYKPAHEINENVGASLWKIISVRYMKKVLELDWYKR